VKLQKQLSRKVNGKEYAKYVVVISPSTVEQLGWKQGQPLRENVRKDKLILEPE
jgi:hypothetical protein